jgi:glycosyltransferase involved in cell wall biosynthesis
MRSEELGPLPRGGASSGRRLRALVLAEMANPDWVSVPLVGWSHARALARICDVHLVTQVRNRENILKAGLREGVDFTAIDTAALELKVGRVARLLRAGNGEGWPTLTALGIYPYYRYEAMIWEQFGERLRRGDFDVVHRITPVSVAVPSMLAKRCASLGVPFVLGPLNGGVPWPKGFEQERARGREWLSNFREFYRWVPGYRSTRDSASAILVGSRYMHKEIGPRWESKTVYMPENAFDPARFPTAVEGAASLPLRVVFLGRLVPLKCVDILLRAAAPLVREGKVVLEIIGDGPERASLEALAAAEKLGAGCTFAGWVGHQDLHQRLSTAHALGFPSIREFGGGVVLESMAMGLVPIVVDYGGPSELVTPSTGFAIPMGSREELTGRYRRVLEELVVRPETARELGRRARDRALQYYTWDRRAEQTLEVYRWVTGQRARPDYGMPFPDLQAAAP